MRALLMCRVRCPRLLPLPSHVSEFARWEVFRGVAILLWTPHWTIEHLCLMPALAAFPRDTPVRSENTFCTSDTVFPNIHFLVAGEGCVGIRTSLIDVKYIRSLFKKKNAVTVVTFYKAGGFVERSFL